MITFVLWYALIVLLGIAAFPLSRTIFRSLPDLGYGVSKILGLLLLSYIHWILVNLGLNINTQAGGVASFVVMTFGVFALTGGRQLENLGTWLRDNIVAFRGIKQTILWSELLFLAAFIFWAWIRSLNPEIAGTEKPMELAFINSIMRSTNFPPADPWLSGYAISYYHFGYIMTALLALITGTAGSIAFNLMLALVIALAMTAAYSIVFNLLNHSKAGESVSQNTRRWISPLVGPLFLGFVSNTEGFLEVLAARGFGWQNGVSAFWQWLNIKDLNVPPAEVGQWPPRFWFWWRASRVLQDYDLVGNFNEIIDEFPVFSYLLGDLHPHVLSIPFVLLLVTWGLAIIWNEDDNPAGNWEQIGLLAIAAGGMAFLNTWDFPIYLGLVAALQFFAIYRKTGWSQATGKQFLLWAIPLGVLSILFYLPFYVGFSSQAGGILPNIIFPTRGAYIWIMFLPLLVPVCLILGYLVKKTGSKLADGAMIALLGLAVLGLFSTVFGWVASNTADGAALMNGQGIGNYASLLQVAFERRLQYVGGLVTLALVFALGAAVIVGYIRYRKGRTALFLAFIGTVAVLLVIVPEFVYLRDQFGNRMNTVFKFYYEAWILWAILAAYGIAKLLQTSKRFAKVVLAVLFAITTGVGLVYTFTALPDKAGFANLSTRSQFTLDGAFWLQNAYQDDWAAISWLKEQPRAVIVEAVGGSYTDFARISTFSGQPTLLGWPGHEGQWRGGYNEVGSRQQDVEQIYTNPDWATTVQLLQKYGVVYVIVGNMERTTYAVNETKFQKNMALAAQFGNTLIYQVATVR